MCEHSWWYKCIKMRAIACSLCDMIACVTSQRVKILAGLSVILPFAAVLLLSYHQKDFAQRSKLSMFLNVHLVIHFFIQQSRKDLQKNGNLFCRKDANI